MTEMAKHFVEVGHINSWSGGDGKPKIEITAPLNHLPPGTKLYARLETLDPQPVEPPNEAASS